MAKLKTMPGKLDWEVYAGDRNRETFEFSHGGQPWDLTGAVVTCQSRATASDPVVALEATVEDDDPAAGSFVISWDGEAVRALLDGAETWEGVFDIQVLETGETLPVTVVRGAWTATHDVTRQP